MPYPYQGLYTEPDECSNGMRITLHSGIVCLNS
jgi:hypothetical protein